MGRRVLKGSKPQFNVKNHCLITHAIYTDFSKPFDHTDHEILLKTPCELMIVCLIEYARILLVDIFRS